MSYQIIKPVARCDWCGRFVSWSAAKVELLTPDTAFTAEDYDVKCSDCHEKHGRKS